MFKRKKVGLALGGGGARGLAHIGVLKVLEEYQIPIDMISGTSIGAVIAALYSAEPNAKKLEKEVLETELKSLFDYTISRKGIIKGDKIEKFLKERLKGIKFEDLKIPLYITAYDLKEKREVIFSKGDLAKAIRASISIPGIFFPAENNNKFFVDGSVNDIIPNEVLRKKGSDIVIAVNVEMIKEKKPLYDQVAKASSKKKESPNAFETFNQTMQIIQSEKSKSEILKEKIDLVISPDVENIGTLEFSKAKEAIKKGEQKTRKSFEKLKELTEPSPLKDLFDYLNQDIKIDVRKILRKSKLK